MRAVLASSLAKFTYELEVTSKKRVWKDITKPTSVEVTESFPMLVVHRDLVKKWTRVPRSVATCAFHASDKFIKRILGGELDNDDERWYSNHHLVTPHGLPDDWSATVIHQLVEPYGIGVAGIRYPKRALIPPYKEYPLWIARLGANPLYLTDYTTTNPEALSTLAGEDPDLITEFSSHPWGVEASDIPFRPGIIMRQGNESQLGHNGSASYVGPRSCIDQDWKMSIRLARLENISCLPDPPPLPKYEECLTNKPDIWSIVDIEGKSMEEWAKEADALSAKTRREYILPFTAGPSYIVPFPMGILSWLSDREVTALEAVMKRENTNRLTLRKASCARCSTSPLHIERTKKAIGTSISCVSCQTSLSLSIPQNGVETKRETLEEEDNWTRSFYW